MIWVFISQSVPELQAASDSDQRYTADAIVEGESALVRKKEMHWTHQQSLHDNLHVFFILLVGWLSSHGLMHTSESPQRQRFPTKKIIRSGPTHFISRSCWLAIFGGCTNLKTSTSNGLLSGRINKSATQVKNLKKGWDKQGYLSFKIKCTGEGQGNGA